MKILFEQFEQYKIKLVSIYIKINSIFEVSEIPPGIYEVNDNNKNLDVLLKANISKDIITTKSKLKTNHALYINEKSYFITILGLSPT